MIYFWRKNSNLRKINDINRKYFIFGVKIQIFEKSTAQTKENYFWSKDSKLKNHNDTNRKLFIFGAKIQIFEKSTIQTKIIYFWRKNSNGTFSAFSLVFILEKCRIVVRFQLENPCVLCFQKMSVNSIA